MKNDDVRLKNLEHRKTFTSEYQPTPEAKSLGHLKKKALEELKNSILDKSFKLIDEKLDSKEITSQELLSIFNKAVEMSGFKSEKTDLNITPPTINIGDVKI